MVAVETGVSPPLGPTGMIRRRPNCDSKSRLDRVRQENETPACAKALRVRHGRLPLGRVPDTGTHDQLTV
jgi:hypothetical protein